MCSPGELPSLIDGNQALIRRRADEILACIQRPMTISQIDAAVCAMYQLFTHKPRRALRFERNIRFFVEYLLDQGRLELECRGGAAFYRPARPQAPQI